MFTGHLIDYVFLYTLKSLDLMAKENFGSGKVTITAHDFPEACANFDRWNAFGWFQIQEVFTAEKYVEVWQCPLPQNASTIELILCSLPEKQ